MIFVHMSSTSNDNYYVRMYGKDYKVTELHAYTYVYSFMLTQWTL